MLHTNDLSPLPVKVPQTWSYRTCWDGERESGAGARRRRSNGLHLHVSERLNNFTEQLHTVILKEEIKGFWGEIARGHAVLRSREKAYNLRSTLIVLKAFSGIRNTKFSAWVALCVFGVFFFFFFPLSQHWPAVLIFSGYTHRSDIFVHPKRETIMLINFSLCPPSEFRCDVPKFGMPRQR